MTFRYHKKAQPAPAAAPLPPPPATQPVRFQQPPERPGVAAPGAEGPSYQVQLELPGPQRLFQLDSERQLRERMRQEALERTPPERITFPEEPVVSRERYEGRHFPPTNVVVEPNYVCYRPLLFQQINAERYGWDLGPLHPFFSTAVFVKDVVFLPSHLFQRPCRYYDCNSGYCLPGDPVPFLFYPPGVTVSGLVAEAAVGTALFLVFP
jgi:hypothetical protein